MYDTSGSDTGHEWIEIINNGTSTIDISKYKLFEGGTNHKLVVKQGSASLEVNAVAVIADNPAKFLEAHPTFSGTLIDSVFAGGLSNTGEEISVKDPGGNEDGKAVYASSNGADGNGLTLSRGLSGAFVATNPTPGVFEVSPKKASVVAKAKTVTPKASGGLKTKASTKVGEVKGASVVQGSVAEPGQVSKPTVSGLEDEQSSGSSNTIWVYILGALGLSVLGAGIVFALKFTETSVVQGTAKSDLQKLVDSYEIIE